MQLRLTAKDKANGSDTGMGKDRARSIKKKTKKTSCLAWNVIGLDYNPLCLSTTTTTITHYYMQPQHCVIRAMQNA